MTADEAIQDREPLFERAAGLTESERYLKVLCDRSFLSLWSYPAIYRDQGKTALRKFGKEVCDLLVVFDNHILIFSDKHCQFPTTENLDLAWRRWYCRAVENSARQIWGAERWVREHPKRLFLDRECTQPFPLPLPEISQALFHRIIVARGAAYRCQKELGGSGSLMIDSTLVGDAHYVTSNPAYRPFAIGQVNPERGYIHVFDDTTLDIILRTLDTISDFVEYLHKKEEFLTSRKVFVPGEEELLAFYLQKVNKNKEHDFVISRKFVGVMIEEGSWEEFTQSEERRSQVAANHISYSWDRLIETFSQNAIANTQHHISQTALHETEKILRFMAREPRTRRRILADSLLECISTTPVTVHNIRVTLPSKPGDPHYVFLLFPHLEGMPEVEYRAVRLQFLEYCCLVTKLRYPGALDIVGIATETGKDVYRSEDAMYLDARLWNDELRQEAIELQQELGILRDVRPTFGTILDYPSEIDKRRSKTQRRSKFAMKGRDRNMPCICGSGVKFKYCCGK